MFAVAALQNLLFPLPDFLLFLGLRRSGGNRPGQHFGMEEGRGLNKKQRQHSQNYETAK
jgi:hypothetical protein